MEWPELKYSGWGHVSQHVTGWTLTLVLRGLRWEGGSRLRLLTCEGRRSTCLEKQFVRFYRMS
jgi:hypothetical protein